MQSIEIINTTEEITNYDNISESFFKKPNSSILLAIKKLSEDESTIGLISSANSGIIMLGSMKYLLQKDMTRPCLGALLPTENDKFVLLVDTGASIDCNSTQLHQFAVLGSEFMKKLYKIENPKVGLLSNGSEPTKGNKLVKETYPILDADKNIYY